MTLVVSGLLYFTGIYNSKAHDYGAPAGYTNSPHDGKSCDYSGCHTTYGLQAKKQWISSWVPGSGYIPDSTYTFFAKAAYGVFTSFGFEISPQTMAGAPMGTLIITNPTTTQIVTSGSLQYITQTANGYQGTDSLTWSFQWKAPSGWTDSVNFYGCFNCGQGTSKSSGIIYPAILTVYQQRPAGIDNLVAQRISFSVFPNPVKQAINISYNLNNPTQVEVNIYGMDGRKISTIYDDMVCGGQHTQGLELPSSVTSGIYFIQMIANGQSIVQKVVVE